MARSHERSAELSLWRTIEEVEQTTCRETNSDCLAAHESHDWLLALEHGHKVDDHEVLHSMTCRVRLFASRKFADRRQDFEFVARAVKQTTVDEDDFDIFVILRGLN